MLPIDIHKNCKKGLASFVTRENFVGWDKGGTIKIAMENTKFAIVQKSEIVSHFAKIHSAKTY